jgi:NAD(P)-dependent dehydrogenase (short-subunit alcohol dehydrogenase family)
LSHTASAEGVFIFIFVLSKNAKQMNKTIFITGASSGLGKDIAMLFASKGWNVIATMRKPEDGSVLAALPNVLVTRLDVLDLDSITAAVDAGIARFGTIDVLVNNAGYGAYGPLESFSREKMLRQFNTNVIGLLDVTRALLPHFRQYKSGIIINVSSIGGKMAFPLGSLYHGTKFAVEGISESLNYEVAQFGGKVKIIEPGAIATDFAGRSLDFSNDESLAAYQPIIGKIMAALPALYQNASPASLIADTIFEAATDGKAQLRYTAGEDAAVFVGNRRQYDDETFIGGVKTQFGL